MEIDAGSDQRGSARERLWEVFWWSWPREEYDQRWDDVGAWPSEQVSRQRISSIGIFSPMKLGGLTKPSFRSLTNFRRALYSLTMKEPTMTARPRQIACRAGLEVHGGLVNAMNKTGSTGIEKKVGRVAWQTGCAVVMAAFRSARPSPDQLSQIKRLLWYETSHRAIGLYKVYCIRAHTMALSSSCDSSTVSPRPSLQPATFRWRQSWTNKGITPEVYHR